MSDLNLALCLPVPEIKALDRGRIISAFPPRQLDQGEVFALYPTALAEDALPIEKYYRASFRPIARLCLDSYNSEEVIIKNWARCEFCQILEVSDALEALPCSEVWTRDYLQHRFSLHPYLFLAHLRVYEIAEPLQLSIQGKVGKFIGLPQPISTDNSTPVLTDRVFTQRHHQLKNLEPPPHLELEELQSLVAQMALTNPDAKALDRDLKTFLGWSSDVMPNNHNSNLDWINTIAALGNRSKDLDIGKSNYEAGTDFENIVRASLEYLGFTVDYAHKGGAGGLDLFCSQPYSLVIECKAGKKIPNDTAVQLLNLGTLRIQDEKLLQKTTKLIIGPGTPTSQLHNAAKVHGMAILKPETLEKLVKLKSQYPGAIDLFKLKEYLQPGQSDDSVEKYIDRIESDMKLRSHLIQIVKNYLETTQFDRASIQSLHGAYAMSQPPRSLKPEEIYELLIELSSPLTGYLGREKGGDWKSDRFYFLRDLAT
jgi:hypothetical protein